LARLAFWCHGLLAIVIDNTIVTSRADAGGRPWTPT